MVKTQRNMDSMSTHKSQIQITMAATIHVAAKEEKEKILEDTYGIWLDKLIWRRDRWNYADS